MDAKFGERLHSDCELAYTYEWSATDARRPKSGQARRMGAAVAAWIEESSGTQSPTKRRRSQC
jgi:hypothetical protein